MMLQVVVVTAEAVVHAEIAGAWFQGPCMQMKYIIFKELVMIKGKYHIINSLGRAYVELTSLMDNDMGQGGIGP
jgi:hypothetical protein